MEFGGMRMKKTMRIIILLSIVFYSFSFTKEWHVFAESFVESFDESEEYIGESVYSSSNLSILGKKRSSLLILVNKRHGLKRSYIPMGLITVNAPSVHHKIKMRRDAARSLERMIYSAKKSGISLYCLSGYRSYNVQAQLYNRRLRQRGKKYTDRYVAKPGKSEHQTGLAVDIINRPYRGSGLRDSFGSTKEGRWLAINAHKYGFILRYPRGKENITGYNYEPWHYRYVGVAAAKQIKQRRVVLEEYLSH
jgi:D-alanyl-D-alanine carboxypeptidase